MKIIDLSVDKNNPGRSFKRIAEKLMNHWILVSGSNRYRIAEIEFYLRNDDWHKDVYTHGHPMQKTSHHWYFHGSGIDITFGQDDFYGGILLRAIYDLNKDEYHYGPLVLLQELFSNFPDIHNTHLELGLIPDAENSIEREKPIAAPRIGLNPKHDQVFYEKNYRFLVMPKKKHGEKTRIWEAMEKSGYSKEQCDNIWG